MLECVVNVSEGRDTAAVAALAAAAGRCLLDVHSDAHHHRSVLTLAGDAGEVEAAARSLTAEAVRRLDLRGHDGVHPRMGVVDVVPFVPLHAEPFATAVAARDRFAAWAGDQLGVPCFVYGPERTLPEVRRGAFLTLRPDTGPDEADPATGAIAVGARSVLVAYNLWLTPGTSLDEARSVAAAVRSRAVRALGLPVGDRVMVSCNLVRPLETAPADAYDAVAALTTVDRAELVGLVPDTVLRATPPERRRLLDLDAGRTIEARIQIEDLRPRPHPDGG